MKQVVILLFTIFLIFSFVFFVSEVKAFTLQDIVKYLVSVFTGQPQTTGTQGAVVEGGIICPQIYCVRDQCPGQHIADANGCINCASPCPTTTTTTCLPCTQWTQPSPEWYTNCANRGGTVINPQPDNCGCYGPPSCTIPTTTTTPIFCTNDFDCPSGMKCTDYACPTCPQQSQCPYTCIPGRCVDVGCVPEGGMIPGAISPDYRQHMATTCCAGLSTIEYSGRFDQNCNRVAIAGEPAGVCSKCGNGICESWETKCNCPSDCGSSCTYGTATATNSISFGNYQIYADLGSNSNWARIVIKNYVGNALQTMIINQGDSRDIGIETVNFTIRVVNVRALQDGTVLGVDLAIGPNGTYCPPSRASITTDKINYQYDETITFYLSGFTPNSAVNVSLNYPGISVGRGFTTDSYGRVSGTILLGRNLPAYTGDATLQAVGANSLTAVTNLTLNLIPATTTTTTITTMTTMTSSITTTSPPPTTKCNYGTATATNSVNYDNYYIYADLGSNNNWARILVKNSRGDTLDTKIINQGDSWDFSSLGLRVSVIKVRAIQDGTVLGVDLTVGIIGCLAKVDVFATPVSGLTAYHTNTGIEPNLNGIEIYSPSSYKQLYLVGSSKLTFDYGYILFGRRISDNIYPVMFGYFDSSQGKIIISPETVYLLNSGESKLIQIGVGDFSSSFVPERTINVEVGAGSNTFSYILGFKSAIVENFVDIKFRNKTATWNQNTVPEFKLGNIAGSPEADEIVAMVNGQPINIGNNDADVLTDLGWTVRNPHMFGASDTFAGFIPVYNIVKPSCPYQCCENDLVYESKICPLVSCACAPCLQGQFCPPCVCPQYVCQNHQCIDSRTVGHDVAVINYTAPASVDANKNFTVSGTVVNQGNYSETVSVSISACPSYYSEKVIQQIATNVTATSVAMLCRVLSITSVIIESGQARDILTTASLPQGSYRLVFSASIPYDSNSTNNYQSSYLTVSEVLPTYVLNFKTGWNLFSVPVDLSSNSDTTTNCVEPVSRMYGLMNGTYYEVTSAPVGGNGYWLKMKNDCTVNITGRNISISDFPSLITGWNMIGAPSEQVTFADYTGNCNVTRGPLWYDPSQSKYVDSSTLDPGKGYFVKVTSDCKLGVGPPPPLPQ